MPGVSMITLLSTVAFATPGFDPTAPDAVFTGVETQTHATGEQLWSRVDRWSDPDRELFTQEEFNEIFRWKDSEFTPHMETLFGSPTPHSSSFLLHYGLREASSAGTPVLLVHGAGDNASRPWFTLRRELEDLGRPVYAITFAHPHGDIFQQAENIADAIAVIKARTGAEQVDLIAHSKGGLAVSAYTSHHADADWGGHTYEDVGTAYQGDVRRMVLVGTPLGGIDTAYRWSASNFFGLDADLAVAPVSWDAYYPYGAAMWWSYEDLSSQDFLPDGADVFPGQRQMLRRQEHALPGGQPWLGGYALQTDWWTTYEGGTGFFSSSSGIDAGIEAGGYFMDHLAANGVDPDVELFLLAGTNPMMPNGEATFKEIWDGLASASQWGMLLSSISTFVGPVTSTDAELAGLATGDLVLGEVSGPSDGVLFLTSALASDTVTGRGAQVVATRTVDVSHTELLLASDDMGFFMHALAGDDPAKSWMKARGDRYVAENTTAWVAQVLADAPPAASDPNARGEAGLDDDPVGLGGIGCSSAPGLAGWLTIFVGAVFVRRQR
jgi:triacylglycerol lipase